MESLTKEQAIAWCEQRAVSVTKDEYLYYRESRRCVAIELPEKPFQLVALANSLLPYSESVPFAGALLWIRRRGIWNELVERAGLRVMEVIRRAHGGAKTLWEAPGYLFDSQELVDLQVCLIQPLLIGWDAFLVPDSGDYVAATSHDETTFVLTRTSEVHEKLLAELKIWNPRENGESYFKGTAIPPSERDQGE